MKIRGSETVEDAVELAVLKRLEGDKLNAEAGNVPGEADAQFAWLRLLLDIADLRSAGGNDEGFVRSEIAVEQSALPLMRNLPPNSVVS